MSSHLERVAVALVPLALVPSLGILAYTYLFRDYLGRFHAAHEPDAPAEPATTLARPPEEA